MMELNIYEACETLWSVWANDGTLNMYETWKIVVCIYTTKYVSGTDSDSDSDERLWYVWANGGTEYVSGTCEQVVCMGLWWY